MTASEDLAAAALHVSALRDAVASLQAHVGETIDIGRLKDEDLGRVGMLWLCMIMAGTLINDLLRLAGR